MGGVVIECFEKDRADSHFKLFWLKVELKRKQNGKIEEYTVPRMSRNLHKFMHLNKKNQLDYEESAAHAFETTGVCKHCRRSRFECYDQLMNNLRTRFHQKTVLLLIDVKK